MNCAHPERACDVTGTNGGTVFGKPYDFVGTKTFGSVAGCGGGCSKPVSGFGYDEHSRYGAALK